MKIETASLHLSMKVMPEKFAPFDVNVGFTVTPDPGETHTDLMTELRKLCHLHLEEVMRIELDSIYGAGKASQILGTPGSSRGSI